MRSLSVSMERDTFSARKVAAAVYADKPDEVRICTVRLFMVAHY